VLIALIAGALLGIALGTVRGGGAVLAVPVLGYLLGQSVHAATAESLVIVLGASSAGAISHARHGAACWKPPSRSRSLRFPEASQAPSPTTSSPHALLDRPRSVPEHRRRPARRRRT
jgi:hypothetical protein